ncbi:MAG: SoxY-related AACIE arm protein [Burkholderiaceae bacterium]|jgi:sulfur-oxidizing protein SoxY|nr:SoxY-related AACIE arm protein [Burkholderiaceae bacterium]MDP4968844.1 SoxY-related AACIE arm protein [Burkholderiaceae bacterium]MDP5111573.1 SoxY-related AACIE arm protein [Burkholderiaceae bacterium]
MSTSRRSFIVALGSVSVVPWLNAQATTSEAVETIKKIVGQADPRVGRVTLDIAPLVENGNLVPMTVSVESPMTSTDFVKAIHIISEKNPLPNIVSFNLGARAGRAQVSTRIRLLTSQRLWAIAEMNDGSFWQGHADTVVTLAACTEDVLI